MYIVYNKYMVAWASPVSECGGIQFIAFVVLEWLYSMDVKSWWRQQWLSDAAKPGHGHKTFVCVAVVLLLWVTTRVANRPRMAGVSSHFLGSVEFFLELCVTNYLVMYLSFICAMHECIFRVFLHWGHECSWVFVVVHVMQWLLRVFLQRQPITLRGKLWGNKIIHAQ